jgi:hypothetical protein
MTSSNKDYVENFITNGTGYEPIWRKVGDGAKWVMEITKKNISLGTVPSLEIQGTYLSNSHLEKDNETDILK